MALASADLILGTGPTPPAKSGPPQIATTGDSSFQHLVDAAARDEQGPSGQQPSPPGGLGTGNGPSSLPNVGKLGPDNIPDHQAAETKRAVDAAAQAASALAASQLAALGKPPVPTTPLTGNGGQAPVTGQGENAGSTNPSAPVGGLFAPTDPNDPASVAAAELREQTALFAGTGQGVLVNRPGTTGKIPTQGPTAPAPGQTKPAQPARGGKDQPSTGPVPTPGQLARKLGLETAPTAAQASSSSRPQPSAGTPKLDDPTHLRSTRDQGTTHNGFDPQTVRVSSDQTALVSQRLTGVSDETGRAILSSQEQAPTQPQPAEPALPPPDTQASVQELNATFAASGQNNLTQPTLAALAAANVPRVEKTGLTEKNSENKDEDTIIGAATDGTRANDPTLLPGQAIDAVNNAGQSGQNPQNQASSDQNAAKPQDVQLDPQQARQDPTLPGTPTDQVSQALARGALRGGQNFTLQLKPEALGAVEVRVRLDAKGRATASFIADHPETVQVLQRDSHHLVQSLADAGVSTDANGLNFSLRDGSGGSFAEAQDRRSSFARTLSGGTPGFATHNDGAEPPVKAASSLNRLYDIKA